MLTLFVSLNMAYNITYFESPVGRMILASSEEQLVMSDWYYRKQREQIDKRIAGMLNEVPIVQTNELLDETKRQLNAYFDGRLEVFDLPVKFCGTNFQVSVWNHLMNIKFGDKKSYKQLAIEVGDVGSIRAVAAANGANALSIIVPCHRVVGSSGELVGYAGGLQAKRKLLDLENHGYGSLFD